MRAMNVNNHSVMSGVIESPKQKEETEWASWFSIGKWLKIPNFWETIVHNVCAACILCVFWKRIQPNESCETQLQICNATTNFKSANLD
jgi:hypothetical protein